MSENCDLKLISFEAGVCVSCTQSGNVCAVLGFEILLNCS